MGFPVLGEGEPAGCGVRAVTCILRPTLCNAPFPFCLLPVLHNARDQPGHMQACSEMRWRSVAQELQHPAGTLMLLHSNIPRSATPEARVWGAVPTVGHVQPTSTRYIPAQARTWSQTSIHDRKERATIRKFDPAHAQCESATRLQCSMRRVQRSAQCWSVLESLCVRRLVRCAISSIRARRAPNAVPVRCRHAE